MILKYFLSRKLEKKDVLVIIIQNDNIHCKIDLMKEGVCVFIEYFIELYKYVCFNLYLLFRSIIKFIRYVCF